MRLAQITSKYRAGLISEFYCKWVKKNKKLLDIGCGTGVVGSYLENSLSSKVVGCDIEDYLISNIQFKIMKSNTKLPFKDNEFDYAMFNDVLHHTPYKDQVKLLKESSRVAKETLVFELNPTLTGKAADFTLNKIHNPNMLIPYTYRTEKNWQKLFKSLGLKYTKKQVDTPIWYPFTHVAFKLSKS